MSQHQGENGNGGSVLKLVFGVLQACLIASTLWAGSTIASLNREVGQLQVEIASLKDRVNRLQVMEDRRINYIGGTPREDRR